MKVPSQARAVAVVGAEAGAHAHREATRLAQLVPELEAAPPGAGAHTSAVNLNHSSLIESVERVLERPFLSTVAGANDCPDFFQAGVFP